MDISMPWYALQTKPRAEKQVERLLYNKGYDCLLPTYRQKRQWSDRIVESETPLFPAYIFCRFSPQALGKAISTPGVVRIVGFGGKPMQVEIEEIEALQLLARSRLLREPWTYIPDGTLVQVETGPMSGAQGVIMADSDKGRLAISVTLLQRSVAVQLDKNTVIKVIEGPKPAKLLINAESKMALKLAGVAKIFVH